jgi:hypothetical protein|tara:strand:- start:41 stop:166 length:126 start_codon:yes stop_codon:yes gene_type:complete
MPVVVEDLLTQLVEQMHLEDLVVVEEAAMKPAQDQHKEQMD